MYGNIEPYFILLNDKTKWSDWILKKKFPLGCE